MCVCSICGELATCMVGKNKSKAFNVIVRWEFRCNEHGTEE